MLSEKSHFTFNCLNWLFWGVFSLSFLFICCVVVCCVVVCCVWLFWGFSVCVFFPSPGCSPGGWSWREVASVPRGDTFNVQVHSHASGWWTMSTGPLTHSNLLKEPSQHGAEEQEENIHAFAEWVSWICACPNGRRPVWGSIFSHRSCMYWTCSAFYKKIYKKNFTPSELPFHCIVNTYLIFFDFFIFWITLCFAFRKVLYLSVIWRSLCRLSIGLLGFWQFCICMLFAFEVLLIHFLSSIDLLFKLHWRSCNKLP